MISKGKTVRIAYDLTVGGRLVKSVCAERPMRYVHGRRQLPEALQKALRGLHVGDRKEIVLTIKDGHGRSDSRSVMEMSKERFAKKDHFVGRQLLSPRDGKYLATVREVRKSTLLLDFNHPYAGKDLHYSVLIVGIEGEGYMKSPRKGVAQSLRRSSR